MSETQRWTPRDDEETAVDQWARRLEGAVTADDVTAEALAEEIGDVPEEYAREVWQRAFDRAINATDRSEFHLSDFVEAHEALEGGMLDPNRSDDQDAVDDADAPDRADQADAEAGDELAQLKAEVRDDDEDANAPQGSTGDDDTSAGGDSPETRCPEDGGDADEAGEPAPAEMDRDELEAEVKSLREDLDKMRSVANNNIPLLTGALRNLLGVDDVEDLPAAAAELQDTISDHDDDLDDLDRRVENLGDVMHDGGTDGKGAKVRAIVRSAQNLRSGDQDVVKLDARDIISATGCSRRYAYDLMDELPDEHGWLLSEDEMSQYGDLEIDKDSQTRALGVDFAGVHSAGCPVNKFTTGGE